MIVYLQTSSCSYWEFVGRWLLSRISISSLPWPVGVGFVFIHASTTFYWIWLGFECWRYAQYINIYVLFSYGLIHACTHACMYVCMCVCVYVCMCVSLFAVPRVGYVTLPVLCILCSSLHMPFIKAPNSGQSCPHALSLLASGNHLCWQCSLQISPQVRWLPFVLRRTGLVLQFRWTRGSPLGIGPWYFQIQIMLGVFSVLVCSINLYTKHGPNTLHTPYAKLHS